MLRRIVELSLRYRGIVLVLACVLVGYGIYVARNTRLDVFPEFVQPQVTVQCESPGLAPEQVEALVTRPIEGVLNGVGNLESIRSESIQGLAVVDAVFKEGTDIFIARQMIAENLGQLSGQLPMGVKAPTLSPLTSSTMDLLKFGLLSKKMTPMQLRSFADWVVKPRLLSVPGVAGIKIYGGEVRQLQIQVKPERLIAFGLSLQDVLTAARESVGISGAGFIESFGQRVVLQSSGQSLTTQQLGEVVVTQHDGVSVRLKDVATVVEAGAPKFGDALIMGKPGVLVTSSSQYGANTMEVTRAVEQALDELKPLFASEGIQYVRSLHRPATFIENAIAHMRSSLFLGAVLVAVVLFLFLFDLRTAFISFSAIPLSLLTAIVVLDHFGVTLNTMTLGGLAVAIGVVVDDAIIDVENILRRLRENQSLPQPRPLFQVILEASLEVRSAIVYASFVVALVFVPVLTMSGLQGHFFAPLGTAFILAIMASLGVALTVTPALCLLTFSRIKPHTEPRYVVMLKGFYSRTLERVRHAPGRLILLVLILVAAAIATLPFFGNELLPDFREGHFVIQVSMAPGTSMPEMLRIGGRISEEILKNQEVQTISQQVGRAEMGEDTWGPHRCEFHVELKPHPTKPQEEVQEELRKVLEQIPGIQSEVLTFLGDRIGETISGETAEVVINIFGEDLDELDRTASRISAVLSGIPGAADVQVKSPPGAPRLMIQLRTDRLIQFGFRPVELLNAIGTAYQGTVAAQTYDGNRVYDLVVILPPADREDPETVGSLLLSNSQGKQMPLRELADVYLTDGRYSILHDGGRRRQTVTCNSGGRDAASFVAEARRQIGKQITFPRGIYVIYNGASEVQDRARNELLLHSATVAIGIVVVLAALFRSGRNLLLILANVPFALVGGILAIAIHGWVTGGELIFSLGTLVGFVTLFGITMRNSIMMISHFEHLVRIEGMVWGPETAIRGALERLVPILMTALVTGLGLLPLALASGGAGQEIESPMAIVILGGLLTSTLLNLLVLPTLALAYGRFEKHN